MSVGGWRRGGARWRCVPVGLAGLSGQVYGHTTPSVTNVDVIGRATNDFAINVHLDDRGEAYWFAPDLLEFIDHGAGTEITLDGVPKKWVRTSAGDWEETDTPKNDGLLTRLLRPFRRRN